MKTALTTQNLHTLIGKTIKWSAPAYRNNTGYWGQGLYGGIHKIIDVDLSLRTPIKVEKIDSKSDQLEFATVGFNNHIAFSDSDRFVYYDEVEDEN